MNTRKPPRALLPALAVCLAAAAAMLVSPSASTQGGRRGAADIAQSLERFDRLGLDPADLRRSARERGRVALQTSRGAFDLEVEPFDVRAADYRAVAVGEGGAVTELARAPSNSWRGRVRGSKDTFVRLALDGESVQGIIITPGETFFVEPSRALSPAAEAGEHVFYAESDVKPTEGECAEVTLAGKVAERAAATRPKGGAAAASMSSTGGTPEKLFAPMAEADVAVEADFEFFQKKGSDQGATTAEMANIMTQVDGIYEAQLGMSLRVSFSRVWTTASDPYTLTESEAALIEFAQKYNGSFGGAAPARDLTHMFTGKEFDGTTIGIAYGGVVCDVPPFSYGISESYFNDTNPLGTPNAQRVAVTAHEIGHNFGASHPNQESPVPPNCAGSIMNSSVSSLASPTAFCQFSKDQITGYVTGMNSQCLARNLGGCTYAVTPALQVVGVGGGAGTVNITTNFGNCAWGVAEGVPWLTFSTEAGTGNGAAGFTVAANNGKDGPRSAVVDIAGQRININQPASPACLAGATSIGLNQTLTGSLAPTDCAAAQPGRQTAYEDLYTFAGRAGQRVRVEMFAALRASDTPDNQETPAEALDCFLYLYGPDGTVVAFNDDRSSSPHDTDSAVPTAGFLTLPATGVYTVAATTFDSEDGGAYSVRVSDNSAASSFSLSAAAYAVDEGTGPGGIGVDGTGFRVVTVNREGDTAGTASVDYATTDGTASRRGDYTQTLGTLVYGPGQASKSFTIFVTEDAYAEGVETVNVTLSNPVGAGFGATTSAVVNINSNDAVSGPSPARAESFNTSFFVRQHYLDFLNREPDAGGLGFWSQNIEECGADQPCREVKRVNVSAAFFLSIEFQETGYFAYRAYKAAYGDTTSPGVAGTVPVVRLGEFLPDTQRIGQGVQVGVGDWEGTLNANKNAYALEFVLRQRFLTAYPLSMTAAQFVDKMNQNAGGVLTAAERNALVAQLDAAPNQTAARAAVLRAVADNAQMRQVELNRAYVLMQYFGYLRRNPDEAPEPGLNYGGWKFWLDKLNEFGGDAVAAEMVKAFITSDEYINRFGQ